MNNDYLQHHGVKGMKWGVRHDYVAKGRHASGKVLSKSSRRKGLSDKAKRRLKIGAIAAGSVLAVAGGVYLYKSGAFGKIASAGKSSIEGIKTTEVPRTEIPKVEIPTT